MDYRAGTARTKEEAKRIKEELINEMKTLKENDEIENRAPETVTKDIFQKTITSMTMKKSLN